METAFKKGFWAGLATALFLAAAGLGVRALVRAGRNTGNSAEMRTFVNPQEQTNKEKKITNTQQISKRCDEYFW